MLYRGCLAMGKTFRSPFLPTREVGENVITHLPTPPLKILLPPVNCTEHWCTSTLNGRVYPSSWLKPDRCYCYYKLKSSPFKANYMTDKQKPSSLARFLWEAWENNFPSSLLPILSPAMKRSWVVSPDALQQKSHVRRTVSLSYAALHSSLSTPGVAGTALVNEKSPCLTSRGCQPTPFGLCAEAGFVPQAVGACHAVCMPAMLCVRPLPWQEGSSPSLLLPVGTHGAILQTDDPKLVSSR